MIIRYTPCRGVHGYTALKQGHPTIKGPGKRQDGINHRGRIVSTQYTEQDSAPFDSTDVRSGHTLEPCSYTFEEVRKVHLLVLYIYIYGCGVTRLSM